MNTTVATKIFQIDTEYKYSPENGLKFSRHFTKDGVSPFDMFEYELRSSVIREQTGKIIFEMNEVEVPKTWSQVATDILAQKYFRKAGVPQYNTDGTAKISADGTPVLGPENSIKQVAHRLAGTWRYWSEKFGYFASREDAQVFYDELVYMIINQMAAPNSPQWFNTGLQWAYGINGPAQGHYYIHPDTGVLTRSEDSYTHPQPHACGRYDTKLFTDKGVLDLGYIVDENLVGTKVFDGSNYVSIKAVKNNGIRKLFRATLKNGNFFEFTDDHLIWSADKREKDGGKYDWNALAQILGKKVQQFSLTAGKMEKIDEDKINKAELAGFVLGDGYYGKYGRNKKTTMFGVVTINDDEFNCVTNIFTKLFGSYTVRPRRHISELYRVVCCDRKVVDEYVQEYGLEKNTYIASVPNMIWSASDAEKGAFLRGLFQADGTVRLRNEDERNSGDVVLTSVSEDLAHGVQVLLLSLGIYSRVIECNDSRSDRHVAYQVIVAFESERKKFADKVGFISICKQEKLSRLNVEILGKSKESLSEESVVAIDYIGEEEVYDIQTETGKFCANGVVVHNCFIQSVKDDLVNEGGIMDLWVREARLFKYGSGTGTNFSALRGRGEPLSGGGTSSGLMSWLKIGDRAAGGIKSGGTTRRAAKMVILDVDHPDIEEFITWKVKEEKKVAAMVAAGYDSHYEGEAYGTVSGQNSNNSVRVTHDYLESVENGADWNLKWRTGDKVCKTLPARDLWESIASSAWSCADPGLQFDTTINEWHTCPQSGRINASNPCSEYMFIDNTACNLASINLAHFYDSETASFDVESFKYATRLWTVVLETSVLMAQFPSKEIAEGSYNFRTLGLGYANIGSVLMTGGIPYDSPEALAFAGSVTAIMGAQSYITSAEMAKNLGPFPKFKENRADMLRVIRNHRRAAFNASDDEYEGLSVKPVGISEEFAPAYLLVAARNLWNDALEMGERYGYRNAQTTLLAPTGTIGLVMDCSTTGVEPDFALVKFKKLAGGGYFKIVNESVPMALKTLGYNSAQINDIAGYLKGHATLKNCPHINSESLKARGFNDDDIAKIEKTLLGAFEMGFVFNVWTLGEECLGRLGFTSEQYNDPNFNLLKALGFTDEQVSEANEYVCGAMTIEGAPHLKPEHYAVFDTANKNGKKGQRYIHYLGHIRMMAAVQPFLCGSISKTINMPNEASVEDIKIAYMASWKLALKCNAIYRDGCKMSQPLSAKSKKTESKKEDVAATVSLPLNKRETPVGVGARVVVSPLLPEEGRGVVGATSAPTVHTLSNGEWKQDVDAEDMQMNYAHDGTSNGKHVYIHGEQRKLPYKRSGMTIKARVGGQKLYLRTGEFPDGKLGEVFIDMYKEGASFRSLLNLFAMSISTGLQYGVPLEDYVDKFTFTRFEPSGMTDHPNVKFSTSIIDFIFRVIGMEYLGRTDFVQVKPTGIQRNRAQQLARIAQEATAQTSLELETPESLVKKDNEQVEIAEAQMTLPKMPSASKKVTGADAMLSGMMGDAPPCGTCGHITIRSGSCYKCLNCGSTTGCS
ncbi:MAG: ribonucleoside-diphosphate reductase, adenosylcobalamin-dependent [Candidatus Magasanikbacteria bacterium RIFOXYD2_FULL_41_14]|uniref:Vitamin B12-dependent ribonucleotide reductase n=1 Tax=Candidatus Magasanikbacteria bacterium RIFOXYD2_FULL_41_14 TaxID=1798709 RepID=A0A1F6PDM8_9BACT|nr:MAG: ribonucleoside-diphosphate reductase, adenosylcobalamin-dependent [Candidatus Magasanikbacteria bacterium RIFOXYD2_FULL_41_14]